MMTVMQWLAALAIVLGSLGAAVAQDTGSKSPAGPTILVPTPSSVAEVPRRTLPQAQDTRDNRRSYPRLFPITGGCR
jgi:hypothetical protein